MTIQSKRIKTAIFTKMTTLVAASTETSVIVDTFIAQRDITLIGIEMCNYLYLTNPTDSGTCEFEVRFTRSGWGVPGLLFSTLVAAFPRQATEGVNVGVGVWGSINNERTVFFPEGYGVDLDDGEVINMMTAWKNEMAQDQVGWCFGEYYYVDR